jgi:hypothetical protein
VNSNIPFDFGQFGTERGFFRFSDLPPVEIHPLHNWGEFLRGKKEKRLIIEEATTYIPPDRVEAEVDW